MISNLLKSVGSVFLLVVFLLVVVGALYLSYIVAIGVLIIGAVFVGYHLLSSLEPFTGSKLE